MVVEVSVHSPVHRTATIHPFFSGDFDCFPVVNGRLPRRESCRSKNSTSSGGGGGGVRPVRSWPDGCSSSFPMPGLSPFRRSAGGGRGGSSAARWWAVTGSLRVPRSLVLEPLLLAPNVVTKNESNRALQSLLATRPPSHSELVHLSCFVIKEVIYRVYTCFARMYGVRIIVCYVICVSIFYWLCLLNVTHLGPTLAPQVLSSGVFGNRGGDLNSFM